MVDETDSGWEFQLLIGYAWDMKNILAYEENVDLFATDLWDKTAMQGFQGIAWYHYYGRAGKSPFTMIGSGLYNFAWLDDGGHDPGFGVQFGGGYQFARHFQIGGCFSFGRRQEIIRIRR